MKERFPDATLVNATSAGANETTVAGLVPHVDHQMIMTYNYRWRGSTVTGAIAPLDHATRNVKIHIAKMLQWAPREQVLMGVPYYGYDWPVTSKVPNATVRSDKRRYGPVRTVTYRSARIFLREHPKVVRRYDALEGSGFYTYWSSRYKTYRQVYFEDERSVRAKYAYVKELGLAGVGIWTLDNDRGLRAMQNELRDAFYRPVHRVSVGGRIAEVRESGGDVFATVRARAKVTGNVPERGYFAWTIRDPDGDLVRAGRWPHQTLYPDRLRTPGTEVRLGPSSALVEGDYQLRIRFIAGSRTWHSEVIGFAQPY
jgi:spore germination protein